MTVLLQSRYGIDHYISSVSGSMHRSDHDDRMINYVMLCEGSRYLNSETTLVSFVTSKAMFKTISQGMTVGREDAAS